MLINYNEYLANTSQDESLIKYQQLLKQINIIAGMIPQELIENYLNSLIKANVQAYNNKLLIEQAINRNNSQDFGHLEYMKKREIGITSKILFDFFESQILISSYTNADKGNIVQATLENINKIVEVQSTSKREFVRKHLISNLRDSIVEPLKTSIMQIVAQNPNYQIVNEGQTTFGESFSQEPTLKLKFTIK